MFEKLGNFFGRAVREVPDRTALERAVGTKMALSDEMSAAQAIWRELYAAEGGLCLASAIAAETARLITIEMRSEITGSRRAEFLQKAYSKLIENIRIPVEYGCADGGVVFKPYAANGKIEIDIVRAESFIPTAYDNSGQISGAVFVQRITQGGEYLTRLEYHNLSGKVYTIKNRAYRSRIRSNLGQEIELSDIPQWSDLAAEVSIGNISRPLFGYFRPAAANTIDRNSPLGVSVYAKAADLIGDADKQYSRLLWEFESGERALIANTMAFKLDRSGKPKLPDKRLYRTLDVDDCDFFREWSPALREENIIRGLDRIFRQIEFSCGLAYGTLSDVGDCDKTAEEVRASKQRSYATVADNQKALRRALCDTVYAMDVWCTLYRLAPMGKWEISFEFDDSIVADRRTEFEEKRKLVECGIMEPWEFRVWYFGEDSGAAKRILKENRETEGEKL